MQPTPTERTTSVQFAGAVLQRPHLIALIPEVWLGDDMAYSAMVRRFMVLAPSDVPASDIECVAQTIYRWNVTYGPSYAAAVLPVGWKINAAPVHGSRPQESLNRQLVDDADFVLALFWHRLGTDTGVARSGTVEEVQVAHDAGKSVAILRCRRDIPSDAIDSGQLAALDDYFREIQPSSLYLTYADEAELAQHVHTLLAGFVTRDQEQLAPDPTEPVVLQADIRVRVDTRSRGLRGVGSERFLVIHNVGAGEARDVFVALESESSEVRAPELLDAERAIEFLGPDSELRYQVILTFGTAAQARCVVTWTDDAGEKTRRFTVRFY